MKQLICLAALISIVVPFATTEAQNPIPNPGFETWTAGTPNNWYTNNAFPVFTPVTQSTDAHSGSFSLKGAVGMFFGALMPPVVFSGTTGQGFAVGARYGSLTGYYKYTPVGGDSLAIFVSMVKKGRGVGIGVSVIASAVATYSQFSVPITYIANEVPDTTTIMILSLGGHAGTTFNIDDLAFGAATFANDPGKAVPTTFGLAQNYPNPFNPATTIRYSLPKSAMVSLRVFNTLGQEVAALVDEQKEAGHYQATWNASVPSGVYFYRLQAGEYTQTMKMLLLR